MREKEIEDLLENYPQLKAVEESIRQAFFMIRRSYEEKGN